MGTAFTIDSPLKVAKFGISSVVSIGDDELCENMRKYYAKEHGLDYTEIQKWSDDFRAKRITAYLDLMNTVVNQQIDNMKQLSFEDANDLTKYFDLLPNESPLKQRYVAMQTQTDPAQKAALQIQLKAAVTPGDIEVNIMTKIDRATYIKTGELLPEMYSDASAALRGFANSVIDSSIVFSAGFNRRLYAYINTFNDFFPDTTGYIKKRIVMKVSDFRSSQTQGKFLAKKGLWITEHRIESGLNCGGHAFASDGYLLGPIMEEFKQKKESYVNDMLVVCNTALEKSNKPIMPQAPEILITVQGGIGTSNENQFLFDHYKVDGTGWATPFLLVPEATTLDPETRQLLLRAKEEDLYLSGVSPLGVPFNTVRNTPSEKLKRERIANGRPGSPCPKGHLVSNIEFTKKPICTASVLYQKRKLEQLRASDLSETDLNQSIEKVVDKTCLCEDLASGALIHNDIQNKRALEPTVCPGPNLAYFSKISTLSEMIDHIYGKISLLNNTYRSNMFINELKMYIDYFSKEIQKVMPKPTDRQVTYLETFQNNLFDGIQYYTNMIPKLVKETQKYQDTMNQELQDYKAELEQLISAYTAKLV